MIDFCRKRSCADKRCKNERQIGKDQVLFMNAASGKTAETRQKCAKLRKIRKRKENPSERNRKQNHDLPEKRRYLFQPFQKEKLFERQKHTVIKSPGNEVPACTMPQARERPDDKNIHQLAGFSFSVSSQRDINIFSEQG